MFVFDFHHHFRLFIHFSSSRLLVFVRVGWWASIYFRLRRWLFPSSSFFVFSGVFIAHTYLALLFPLDTEIGSSNNTDNGVTIRNMNWIELTKKKKNSTDWAPWRDGYFWIDSSNTFVDDCVSVRSRHICVCVFCLSENGEFHFNDVHSIESPLTC